MNTYSRKIIDVAAANRTIKADRVAKGIVDHEFSQAVIDRCEPQIQAMLHRINMGLTTEEEEEAALLAEWKLLKSVSR